jgi:hypothetical protein
MVTKEQQDLQDFNQKLARILKKLKKDAGVHAIRQDFKGTGRLAHRRQIWLYPIDNNVSWDLWLEGTYITIGWFRLPPGGAVKIPYEKTEQETYQKILENIKRLRALFIMAQDLHPKTP